MNASDSNLVSKGPCAKCGSSDANATYDDGHTFCFSCNSYGEEDGVTKTATPKSKAKGLLPLGEFEPWRARKLTEETCKKWGITLSEMGGKPVRIFNYRDTTGTLVAQKVRGRGKDFKFLGDTGNAGLFGQHLWRDRGKRVVITEGEVDAASVSQVQGHKWPVVSVPNGAAGAKKALQKSLDWLLGFEEVVLLFDNDDAGQGAVRECQGLFRPGQCKVAKLPLKDANEMLKAGRGSEIVDAIWGAKELRPDGIVLGTDLWDELFKDDTTFTYALPFQRLQEMVYGAEPGEVITFTSGTGMGKSSIVRTLVHHFATSQGLETGLMFFEETMRRTALGIMSIEAGKNYLLMSNPKEDHDYRKAFENTIGNGKVSLYNHFGSTNIDNVVERIRYMAKALECKVVVVDHLSILVSGMEEGDERRLIDNAMTALKTVAMECGIILLLVSHLKRPTNGKGHEQGGITELAQLRGSAAIGQLSDIVIGLERNQQDEKFKNITTIRVLKSRRTGDTGVGGWLRYEKTTSRLTELLDDPFEEGALDQSEYAFGNEGEPF